jgi:hypothetical protein
VLENPDNISKTVLAKGLDSGTAFEILSIDIADVDVGKNIGAELQTTRPRRTSGSRRRRPRSGARWPSRRAGEPGAGREDARERGRGRGAGADGDRGGVPQRQPRDHGLHALPQHRGGHDQRDVPRVVSLEELEIDSDVRHDDFHDKLDQMAAAERAGRRPPNAFRFTKDDDLRKAIIMSEVLGPPKGLEDPHASPSAAAGEGPARPGVTVRTAARLVTTLPRAR